MRSSGSSARSTSSGPVPGGGEPGGRDRLGGDVTLERRRLLLDGAYVGFGHRPVAAGRRHVARRPVRQGDDPPILRLDGQGDRALARRPRRCPTRRRDTPRGSARRATARRPRAGRARGSRRPRSRTPLAPRARRRRRGAGSPSARAGRSRRRAAAPRDPRASGRARHGLPPCAPMKLNPSASDGATSRPVAGSPGASAIARCAHSIASRPRRREVARKALRWAIVAESRTSSTSARRSHARVSSRCAASRSPANIAR